MLSLANQVSLIGRAGHQPELSFRSDGQARAYLKLYQDDPVSVHRNQLHHLVAWRAVGEQLYRRVRRGDRVLVQGKIVYRRVNTATGDGNRTEIHVNGFTVLDRNSGKLAPQQPSDESGPIPSF